MKYHNFLAEYLLSLLVTVDLISNSPVSFQFLWFVHYRVILEQKIMAFAQKNSLTGVVRWPNLGPCSWELSIWVKRGTFPDRHRLSTAPRGIRAKWSSGRRTPLYKAFDTNLFSETNAPVIISWFISVIKYFERSLHNFFSLSSVWKPFTNCFKLSFHQWTDQKSTETGSDKFGLEWCTLNIQFSWLITYESWDDSPESQFVRGMVHQHWHHSHW